MIARPPWEKPLRRRLRARGGRRRMPPVWLRQQAGLVVVGLFFHASLVVAAARLLGPGGGGTGGGIVAGLVGALLGPILQSIWRNQGWFAAWTPASPTALRRLQTREALPGLVGSSAVLVAVSMAGSLFSPDAGPGETAAGTTAALATGFLLSGGRISRLALWGGAIWTIGYCILSPWLLNDGSELAGRVVKGAVHAWLPVLPWSLACHGAPASPLQWLLPGTAMLISLREWRRSLAPAPGAAPERPSPAETEESGILDREPADEEPIEPASPELDEELRARLRKQVAFAWFGLTGYLPQRTAPWIDRVIWRWLTPRQRMISTLGSHSAFTWFAGTRRAALALALMAGVPWLWQGAARQAGFNAWLADRAYWILVGFLALAVVALIEGWPARRSRFQPWLEPMMVEGAGRFPAFALLPVTPGEWLRAAAKEWCVRSAWIATLWSLAIAAALPAFSPALPAGRAAAGLLAPWLLGPALFPLSAMNRLIRAVSGPFLRGHGFRLTAPAILAACACPLSTLAATFALATGRPPLFVIASAVAASTGWAGLAWTLGRCRDRRLDLKPKPLV